MAASLASLGVLLVLAAPAPTAALKVTPVQKVLEMLSEMKAKGISEMEAEQKLFREYTEWVDDETTRLGFEIKTAKSDIEELVAFIEKADNDVAQLAAAIAELEAEIAGLEADQANATEIRNADHEEY